MNAEEKKRYSELSKKYFKHKEFGHVYGKPVLVPHVRIVWPHLTEPRPLGKNVKVEEGKEPPRPKYEATVLLNKTNPEHKASEDVLKHQVAELLEFFNLGNSVTLGVSSIFGKYGDGDNEQIHDPEKYPFYAGHWLLVAKNANQPEVVTGDNKDLAPEQIKGGLIVNALVTPYVTAKGVHYRLERVQRRKDDGERFGETFAKPDFEALMPACEEELVQPADFDIYPDAVEHFSPAEAKQETVTPQVQEAPTNGAAKPAPPKLHIPAPSASKKAAVNIL